MQLYADFEYIYSLLPVEVVVGNKGVDAAFEIMKPVLVVTAVAASLLVEIPVFSQFPDIIVIRSIVRSYREI